MASYNWVKIKQALEREIKKKFVPKMSQYSFSFEEGITLFCKLIIHKVNDDELDACSTPFKLDH